MEYFGCQTIFKEESRLGFQLKRCQQNKRDHTEGQARQQSRIHRKARGEKVSQAILSILFRLISSHFLTAQNLVIYTPPF
ncbi:MAG TPA: hypothetical protein VJ910_06570 [Desulfuromonadales bacterium]|nr:hypothetical protein [Desulfuromonadales bacterium]